MHPQSTTSKSAASKSTTTAATNGVIDMDPIGDRVVVFWSDARTPHEVLPAKTHRFALSIWFSCSTERPLNTDAAPAEAAAAAENRVGGEGKGGASREPTSDVARSGGAAAAAAAGIAQMDAAAMKEQLFFEAIGQLSKQLFLKGPVCTHLSFLISSSSCCSLPRSFSYLV